MQLKLPGYAIEREIGRGPSGRVYLGVQRNVGRLVAIKVLEGESLGARELGERFLSAARNAARLEHSGIVRIHDAGITQRRYGYLVMEYLPGGDLEQRLERGLPLREALGAISDVARALDYAHGRDRLHRNLKPSNILFREDGAVLGDFVMAALLDDGVVDGGAGRLAEAAAYMSPEEAAGGVPDARSDLYSLGVVLYRLLTGDVPYHGDGETPIGLRHQIDPIPRLPAYLAPLQAVIDRFLAKRPENRFQSGAEVAAALEALQEEGRLPDTVLRTQVVSSDEIHAVTDLAAVTASRGRRGEPGGLGRGSARYRRTRAWAAAMVVAVLAGAVLLYPERDRVFEQALYYAGLAEHPHLRERWRAAQSLRGDPNQGLSAIVAGYKRVLAIDPDHQGARSAIDSLASEWRAQIEAALRDDELALAESRLNEALNVFPDEEDFGRLFERIGDRRRAESLAQSTRALLRSRGLDDVASATTAIEAYQEVLRLHPENAIAGNGLERLADYYGQRAAAAAGDGNPAFAMSYLQLAASAKPDYPPLEAVRTEIQHATTLQVEIRSLLARAAGYRDEGALVAPPGANAAEIYRRVLATDPHNHTAAEGLEAVAEAVHGQGAEWLAAGRLEALRGLMDRASEVGLSSDALAALESELSQRERHRDEIARLLGEARQLLADGFITEPEGDNAVARLERVQALDPGNGEARSLLEEAGERLAEVAREAHEVGLAGEARDYLGQALALHPQRSEWRRLLERWRGAERAAPARDGDAPALPGTAERAASP